MIVAGSFVGLLGVGFALLALLVAWLIVAGKYTPAQGFILLGVFALLAVACFAGAFRLLRVRDRRMRASGISPPPGVTVNSNAWAILLDEQEYLGDIDLFWEFIAVGRLNELWQAHREYILAKWVARRPGTRPQYWWLNDMHKTARQQLSGKKWDGSGYWCGALPGGSERWWHDGSAVFESQAAFLLRKNVLFPGEMERLTPTDFAPVTVPMPDDSLAGG